MLDRLRFEALNYAHVPALIGDGLLTFMLVLSPLPFLCTTVEHVYL